MHRAVSAGYATQFRESIDPQRGELRAPVAAEFPDMFVIHDIFANEVTIARALLGHALVALLERFRVLEADI